VCAAPFVGLRTTFLPVAAQSGTVAFFPLASLLVRMGSLLSSPVLLTAAARGDLSTLRGCVDEGSEDVHQKDGDSYTAMAWAAMEGCVVVVETSTARVTKRALL
jgi:hypothetical protein